MIIRNHTIAINTLKGIAIFDITDQINDCLQQTGISNGLVVIGSRHTTTALTINEHEQRLLDDLRLFLDRLLPPGDRYLHNDIHLRDCPEDEPENAHSHIAAMLLGSTESIAVSEGRLALGQYQSVMLIELDGPRSREVTVQIMGE